MSNEERERQRREELETLKKELSVEHGILHAEGDIAYELHLIREAEQAQLTVLEKILKQLSPVPATGFKISQLIGGSMQADITGIIKGQNGQFTQTPVPAGGQLQAGSVPTWSADDPLVTLSPSADGSTCSATTQVADAGTSFNLTVSGFDVNGVAISSTVNVPLTAAAPPPPVLATGFDIKQTH